VSSSQQLSLTKVLIAGGFLVTLSMGIRHGFGLFNLPVTQANGWGRETFAFALALQNLVWGLSQPLFGGLSDRLGSFKIMLFGGLLYALGLTGMSQSGSPIGFIISAGVLIGVAQSCTTYTIIYGTIGRNCPSEKRVWAMGIVAAMGSFGQFLMIPVEQTLITQFGSSTALIALAGLAVMMLPLAYLLKEPKETFVQKINDQTVRQAIKEAFKQRSFILILLGYFVCGFQVVFIGVHFPAYLKDMSKLYPGIGHPELGTIALALIGLFNVFGTYYAGVLGTKVPKRLILASIYVSRSVAIILFLYLPISTYSIYLFSAVMGILWLSTVPVTNALIAQIFGVKYLAMLSGFAFLSHQLGSFMGVYLGGYFYDLTGSYDWVWLIAIALGILAGLVNLPIKETTLVRPSNVIPT
jgi:MFS family permease